MHLLVCDETNLQPNQNVEFFVYGGLAVHADAAGPLSDRIETIRREHGFTATDKLKHQNTSRPKHIAFDEWTAAKSETIAACGEAGAKLIACLVHHGIARNKKDKLIEWQLNTVLDQFNWVLLATADDAGLVIIDRIGDGKEYKLIRAKFTAAVTTGGGSGYRRTHPRLIGYAATCDGASHLSSATDVVLGALAYCINQRGDQTVPTKLWPGISPLIYRATADSSVWTDGLLLRPWQVHYYGPEYRSLKAHVASLETIME